MSSPHILRQMLHLVLLLAITTSCAPQGTHSLPSAALSVTSPTPISATQKSPKPPLLLQAQPTISPAVTENLNINIILGRPTSDTITASLLSPVSQQIILAYGSESGKYTWQTQPVSLQANLPRNIEISQLSPDTTYFYKILDDGAASPEHTFHTQRASGSAFTFTIDADPHNRDPRFNGELYTITLNNILSGHPDFHINLGDTFMTEKINPQTYTETESTFTDLRPYFGLLGAGVPLFLVNGNHEGEMGWLLEKSKNKDLPVWATQLRQLYYPNPLPNDFYTGSSVIDPYLNIIRDGYYAWTWGDALFIVLDPFWYTTDKPKNDDLNRNWNWTLGKEQYDWLKSTLEESNSKYKFVFIHHLVGGSQDARGGIEFAGLFEWGGNNTDGSYGFTEHRPGWEMPIHSLLVQNHVSAVFHGHDHVFVKQELDGIIYQEVPQPNIAEYNNSRIATDYGYVHGDVLSSSGHLRVSVSPEQATVEYVRAYLPQDEKPDQKNGSVDFTYFLAPK